MSRDTFSCPTPPQLWSLVQRLLCEHAILDVSQATLRWSVLYRKGHPCGVLFWIEGPQQIRPSAIWAAQEQRLLLYDSHGERVDEVRLQPGPSLSALYTPSDQDELRTAA